MADLRIENPSTTGEFRELLAAAGVQLPVTESAADVGDILDATGVAICTVDVNGERDDANVARIRAWIIVAVNTCGGFRAERADG